MVIVSPVEAIRGALKAAYLTLGKIMSNHDMSIYLSYISYHIISIMSIYHVYLSSLSIIYIYHVCHIYHVISIFLSIYHVMSYHLMLSGCDASIMVIVSPVEAIRGALKAAY